MIYGFGCIDKNVELYFYNYIGLFRNEISFNNYKSILIH